MTKTRDAILTIAFVALFGATAHAEAGQSPQPIASTAANAKSTAAPSSLVILFDLGSSKLHERDEAILDRASRAYNEGKPIVMTVAGNADLSGKPQANLALSQRRALAVLQGLLDRGIPAARFQLVAKGQTEPYVPTPEGVAEAQNRRVVISWH